MDLNQGAPVKAVTRLKNYHYTDHTGKFSVRQSTTSKMLNSAVIFLFALTIFPVVSALSQKEKNNLREEAKDMFFHGYNAYMENAYPADELMPLSCKGRFRGREPNRGDIDDALGNFSLTLIDSLDTLVIMDDLDEFERGVKLVINNVHFDHDLIVSVFETNIRVVGGLLSAHILSEYLHDRKGRMSWYKGELLNMALDLGYRLLPAFNSTTGLPHPRVNLRHGIKAGKSNSIKYIGETCTACAGTMILEFAALSRLSGEPIFELKASHAMDVLWSSRNRMSNLVGNVVNINTGDWVRRDSGVGAGIDSYYEYVAKAYVLLGEEKYLSRWNTHYSAVMKYLGQGPLLQDVHMHRPHSTSRHFVDALAAFWPGLQVLMGDLKPAIESHEVLYQVVQRHNFIPEAFTMDFQVHWGQHLLRPEFVESTYFLYRATGDPYYLDVGKKVLKSLQKHARVVCGYATIRDVRTMQLEDRMDSFVLAETFKYLYLLFAEDSDLNLDISNFVFTTEGHLLPLSLARLSNRTAVPLNENIDEIHDEDVEFSRACPSTDYMFPGNHNFAESIRSPLANVVEDKCPAKPKLLKRKLLGADFQSNNEDHLKLVKDMGINIVSLSDGRVQLLHTFANAKSPEDAEEGLLFMQEMIELSKQQSSQQDTPPKMVSFDVDKNNKKLLFAGPAQFGRQLTDGFSVTGQTIVANPNTGCKTLTNGKDFWGNIAIVYRGDCMFVEKARILESVGAKGAIVIDNNKGTTSANTPLFAMSGDGTDDVSIPVVFLFGGDARVLLSALEVNPQMKITLQDSVDLDNSPSPAKGEESVSDEEEDSGYDLTSPVSSFLERSRKQVERYFRRLTQPEPPQNVGSGTVELVDLSEDADEIVTVTENIVDGQSNVVKTTFKYNDGNVKTYVAVQTLDENGEPATISVREVQEPKSGSSSSDNLTSQADLVANIQAEPALPNEDFLLEDFLHPDSSSIRRLIEHKVLKNPNVLNEMLSVKFSELLKLFKKLLIQKGSIEAAYLELFQILEEGGAAAVEQRNAEGHHHQRHHVQDASSKPERGFKTLSETLDDDVIDKLLDQFVASTAASNSNNKDNADDRKRKVKAASIINLLADDLMEQFSSGDRLARNEDDSEMGKTDSKSDSESKT